MGELELLAAPSVESRYMRRALVACLALASGCGPIGVFLALRRMSLVGDVAHAILSGTASASFCAVSLASRHGDGHRAGPAAAAVGPTRRKWALARPQRPTALFKSAKRGWIIGSNTNR